MRLSEKLANSPSSNLSKAVKSKKDIKAILDKYSYTDDIDAWVSRNPEALLGANTGICFDTAALQDKLLSDLGITHRNMFAVSKDSLSGKNYTDPSHTFVLHKDTDGLWKWLEGSWEPYRHNKLSAKTSNKLAKQIKKLMEKDNGKSYTLHSIEKYPEEGLSIGEYYMRLLSQAKKHNEKRASFADVKAIYDSLPEDQKRLVSPRGTFVDSPSLQLRVLNKDKTGFAEAYKLKGGPKDSAFVTLAVRPDAQGKGEATAIMRELISQAREKKIKKLIYRLASENDASRRVVQKFVDSPKHKFKDSEEYEINTSPLYHLSQDPTLDTLNPRVPKNFFTEHGYEDSETPRVSLAQTVDGALSALSQGGLEGKVFNVYEALPETIQQHVPSVEEVPDARVTGEHWSLTPTRLKLLKQIQLIKAISPKKFKYGDNEATTYGWSYSDVSDSENHQDKKLLK